MENSTIQMDSLQEKPKRPQLLTILCVLSYIWGAIVVLLLFLCIAFSGFIFEALNQIINGTSNFPSINSAQQDAIQTLLNMGEGKFSAIVAGAIIIYMTSILGVYKMWKLQKWGFYIYASINGLGIIYSIMGASYFMPIISIVFIILYFRNIQYMK